MAGLVHGSVFRTWAAYMQIPGFLLDARVFLAFSRLLKAGIDGLGLLAGILILECSCGKQMLADLLQTEVRALQFLNLKIS